MTRTDGVDAANQMFGLRKEAAVPGYKKMFRRTLTDMTQDSMRWHGSSPSGIGSILRTGEVEPAFKHMVYGPGVYTSAKSPLPLYATGGAVGIPKTDLVGLKTVAPRPGGQDYATSQGIAPLRPKYVASIPPSKMTPQMEADIRTRRLRRVEPHVHNAASLVAEGKASVQSAEAASGNISRFRQEAQRRPMEQAQARYRLRMQQILGQTA